jgi:hypothetical protein
MLRVTFKTTRVLYQSLSILPLPFAVSFNSRHKFSSQVLAAFAWRTTFATSHQTVAGRGVVQQGVVHLVGNCLQ